MEAEAQGLSREGPDYIVTLDGATFRIGRLEVGTDVHAKLIVQATHPGHRVALYNGKANLSGTRSRSEMAKYLLQRCDDVADWQDMVEEAYTLVLAAIEEGEPVRRISEIPQREHARYRVAPIVIERMPTILFGDPGHGKSLVTYVLGMAIHGGFNLWDFEVEKGPVLICDWETDETTAKEQLERLATGFDVADIPEFWDLHYRACYAPLHEEAESIGRYIDREGIATVIIDSLGAACGGDKNSQEAANRMFNAMRAWKVTPLCIDHVAKEQNGRQQNTPYGSVYFLANARSVWRVRGSMEAGTNVLHQGLFHTKANFGLRPPIGLKYTFLPDMENPTSIQVEREDVRDVADFVDKTSATDRIKVVLKSARQSMNLDDIVDETGLKRDQVRARLADMVKRGDVVKLIIKGAASKYAMHSARDEEEAG